MVARSSRGPVGLQSNSQAGFVRILPAIHYYLRTAFLSLAPEAQGEAIQEAVAVALLMYARLAARGRANLAYPSVLARFAIARVRQGRRVAGASRRDVFSRRAQRAQGFTLGPLVRFDGVKNAWQEVLVEDRRATPAEVATTRLDFADWLSRLSPRRRSLAELLAGGATTGEAAGQLGVTAGRVSQLRQQLYDDWQLFLGEPGESGRDD